MEWITLLSSISGSIITILTLATTLIKPLRQKIISIIEKCSNTDELSAKIDNLTELVKSNAEDNEKQKEELARQSEAIQSSLRNDILTIYFNSIHKDYISSWERENVIHLYEAYKKLNGNSFISKCVEEILEIPVR